MAKSQPDVPYVTREELYNVGQEGFEALVRDLFAGRGWDKVRQTPQTYDDGVDIFCTDTTRSTSAGVQTKFRSDPSDTIRRQRIRLAAYPLAAYPLDVMYLVTTGEFTKHGKESADRAGVKLVNGAQLLEWLSETPLRVESYS